MIVRVQISVALLLAIVAFTGCSEDVTRPGVPAEETYAAERATLEGTVALLAEAYEEEDIEKYRACFHPGYEFWFAEDDLDDPGWDWTRWIDCAADSGCTATLFGAEEIIDVRASFTNLTTPGDSANFHVVEESIGSDTVRVFWAEFGVDMHVVEQTTWYDVDHWVDGRARIYLCQDPVNESAWTIWKIEDRGNEHRKAVDSTTWGRVKIMYRPSGDPRRGTKQGLMDLFAEAHQERNLQKYWECLDPNYRFEFSADDLEDPSWDLPDWIGKRDDLRTTDNMFGAPSVTEIRVTFTPLCTEPWGEACEFAVDMHIVETILDSWIDHWVDGRAIITFQPRAQSDTLWSIVNIEDIGNEHRKSDRTTWGSLKKYFWP